MTNNPNPERVRTRGLIGHWALGFNWSLVIGHWSFLLLPVAGLGVSAVMTQLALMRELLGAFSGNELVLGVILANWLLLTGLGAWLGRGAERLQHPARLLVLAQVLVAILPLAQVGAVRALRDAVFLRGTEVGLAQTVGSSFLLLAPYCLVSGFMLTLVCAMAAVPPSGESAPDAGAVGRVYIADSLGSVAGGALFSFVLIPFLDHFALLCLPAMLNLLLAALVAVRFGSKSLAVVSSVLAAGLAGVLLLAQPDAFLTARQYPGRNVVFRGNSPYGRLVVTERDGQLDFVENGLPFLSTHNVERAEETVHYAMAQRPGARAVLLVSGSLSGTAREILKYGVAQVTGVELDPLILEAGRKFLPNALADPRLRVVNTDGRLFIRQAGERYDAIILDLPDPSTSQLNRFYTAEFFHEAKRALAQDGVLCFALGRYENFVSPELAKMLASAHRTARASFTNVMEVPGGRVFFLASDGPLFGDIAARLEQRHIATRLVNRHYLDAMLAPDRLADMRRAVEQPAELNTDFNPVLYYYHLRHWMSQFDARFGLPGAALAVLLVVYLSRLRAVSFTVFASGFAASALEVVLLLGFQVLHGSLYRQLGVIVTVFMAGLAAGAYLGNRRWGETAFRLSDETNSGPGWNPALPRGRQILAALAFGIAALAVALPWVLRGLGQLGGAAASVVAVQVIIPVAAFLLAALAGMEFPLASRLEFRGAAATASRLYTADFAGACLGALLAGTLLIPLLGVTAVCLLTAGLNAAGGAVLLLKSAAR